MYLGLDLGTSGMRGLLVDGDQQVLGVAEAAYAVAHPQPGWSEQDPADWVTALHKVVADLKASCPAGIAGLRGIGISGHMHGATLIDANGEILRPSILWNDTRAHAEATWLDELPGVRDVAGNIVFPGFTAPKLIWVASHEPALFKRIAKALLPKDYLGFWLTGEAVSDMSDSAGTAWLDVGARAWSPALLSAGGMRADQMPRLVEGNAPAAPLRGDRAEALGLPRGVMLVGGGGDNAAAACGVGAMAPGEGFVSLGTSGVLLAARDRYAPDPATAVHTFCHAIPDTWYQMGVILAATDSLNWLARTLDKTPAALSAALGDTLTGPGQVRFAPYLSGERTPHNDAAIRGALTRIDIATGPQDLTRAVMEGVSFALADSLSALRETGADLDRLLAIGGGAQSAYWVELLATVLNLPLDLPAQGEFGAALGAARLAICGVTGAAPADVMTRPAIARTIQPRADLTAAYADSYAGWRSLYPALKSTT